MKAIQIKYIGYTQTKCSRLMAVSSIGLRLISNIDLGKDLVRQARELAEMYIRKSGCKEKYKISSFGMLPNGDYVANLRVES